MNVVRGHSNMCLLISVIDISRVRAVENLQQIRLATNSSGYPLFAVVPVAVRDR